MFNLQSLFLQSAGKIIFIFFMLGGCFSVLLAQPDVYKVFEENFDDNRHGWLVGDRAKTYAQIREGVFYLEGKRERYNYSRRMVQGFLRESQDFQIEIRMRQVSGTAQKGYALEWGGNSLDNVFYEFWLRNDGQYSIDKFDGREFTDYAPWTPSAAIKINDFNLLTVRKQGDKLSYAINGEEVFTMNFTGFFGSEVGFIVPPLAAIEVDYLKISTLDAPPQPVIPKAEVPNIWLVLVGVADYLHEVGDLSFTVNDVMALKNFYESPNGGAVPATNITLLTDKEATRDNILNALRQRAQAAKPLDLLVFYFAGHGRAPVLNERRVLHLLPYEYDGINNQTAIPYTEIQQIIEQSPAKKRLWIMDACHSGGALEKMSGDMRELYRDLEEREIAVLASSNLNQTSLETSEHQRGIFSYYLTEALVGGAKEADEDRDGFVSILELFTYVKNNTVSTAKANNHQQTPQIDGKFNVRLPIGQVHREK
ncbi:MAG: hypothetical protein HC913_20295 [Microscillaceae bacterium]|nr:hypothetical protein [Microscillaceae bacterium]